MIGNIEWLFSDGGSYWGSPAVPHVLHHRPADGHVALLRRARRHRHDQLHHQRRRREPAARRQRQRHADLRQRAIERAVQFGRFEVDPDGTIVEYYWEFGDAFGTHSYEANPTYLYGYAGTYTATLTVLDNNNVSSSDTVTITVGQNSSAVLRSTAINVTAKLSRAKVTTTGQVTVKNGSNAAVSGATVSIRWTKPGGATATQSATTGGNGVATFTTSGNGGTYTLTVTNITKTGYTFDPANSVLSKSITTSSKLSATRAGQNLGLSWPTNVDGFTLQSAPAGNANATWSDVAQSPQVNGTNFAVTVPMTSGAAIYRLVQP